MNARATALLACSAFLLCLSGCLSTITWIWAPSSVNLEEEFVVALDGVVAGESGGMAGIVMQIPSSFEYLGGSYVSSLGRRPLRRTRGIESRFRGEEGHDVIAVGDSISYANLGEDSIRIFLRLRATEAGTFAMKFIAGGITRTGTQFGWRSTDPRQILDFNQIEDAHNRVTISVVEPERNGTAAISFDGSRQYLAVPDSGLFAFTMADDFSVEMWIATTARDAALVSTRTDDFVSAFPFELGLDERGCLQVTCSDGRRVHGTSNTVFLADGVWHHIALAYTAETRVFELFRDGLFLEQLQAPRGIAAVRHDPMVIAARASKRKFYSGIIDELRFWSIRRSPEEIVFYKNIALTGYEERLVACYTFDKGLAGKIVNMASTGGYDAVAYNRPKLVPSLAPLRIELLSFNVALNEGAVEMMWETFDESKVRAYEVEKRDVSGKYTTFERFEPQRKPENHQTYRTTDTWTEKSVYYYRLRRISTDGRVLFSDEIPVGIEQVMNFTLGDNEPNPFSTVTEIPFALSEATYVSLEVYDLLGRLVDDLLSDKRPAGAYRESFDGSTLPPGLYFYKMRTAAGSQTKKMYLARQ
jgi:hypothetical protein